MALEKAASHNKPIEVKVGLNSGIARQKDVVLYPGNRFNLNNFYFVGITPTDDKEYLALIHLIDQKRNRYNDAIQKIGDTVTIVPFEILNLRVQKLINRALSKEDSTV